MQYEEKILASLMGIKSGLASDKIEGFTLFDLMPAFLLVVFIIGYLFFYFKNRAFLKEFFK